MMKYSLFGMMVLGLAVTGCSEQLGENEFEVPLTYLEGESNAGDREASGTAIVNAETGRVEIDVQDLEMLTGDVYEGWLAGGLQSPVSTGRFNTDENGDGMSVIELGDITDKRYTKVVLTIEPEPDSDPGPDSRHSLAGIIPK